VTIKNRLTGLYIGESAPGLAKEKLMLADSAFWLSMFLAWICLAMPGLRYLSFMIPFMTLICILSDRQASLTSMAMAFGWYLVFGLAMYPLANREGLKDLFLATSGISITLLGRMPKVQLWTYFCWFLVGFLIYFGLGGALTSNIRVDLINSYSTFESNYSFVFCLLLPYAAHQRRWVLFLLAAVMAVLTLKRIALLGSIFCVLLVFMRKDIVKALLSPYVMVVVNLAVLLVTMFYSTGHLENLIKDVFGVSGNALGQGRESLQRLPSMVIMRDPEMFLFWGQGAGTAYDSAALSAGMYDKVSLHSDLLKIMYEYGALAFCIFFWLLYATKNHLERIGMLYLNVLLMTDNCLTYYFLLFFVAVVVRTQSQSEEVPRPVVRPKPSALGSAA
jgi:hypothetical protein